MMIRDDDLYVRGFADRTQSYRPYGTDRFKNVFQAMNCLATII